MNQEQMVYDALLNLLKASKVIDNGYFPSWPALVWIAAEYTEHLLENNADSEEHF